MIGISSAPETTNCMFYRVLQSSKAQIINIQHICEACLDAGVEEVCVHRYVPEWIDAMGEKDELINMMIAESNSKEVNFREAFGVTQRINEADSCFPSDKVNAIFSAPRARFEFSPRYIFTGVDPAAGTNAGEYEQKSRLGIVTTDEHSIILGLDSHNVTTGARTNAELVIEHILGVRRIPGCEHVIHVFGVEAGTGTSAEEITRAILADKRCVGMYPMRDFAQKEGLKMDRKAKVKMMQLTRSNILDGKVRIHKNCFPPDLKRLEQLRDELLRYRYVRKPHTNSSGVCYERAELSGKNGSKGCDDLAVAFQWTILMRTRFLFDAKYVEIRNSFA